MSGFRMQVVRWLEAAGGCVGAGPLRVLHRYRWVCVVMWCVCAGTFAGAQVREWVRMLGTIGRDRAVAVAVDGAGGVYVVGDIAGSVDGQSYVGGMSDIFVAKYDRTGARIWTRLVGTPGSDFGFGVACDGGGNVYVVGSVAGSVGGQPYDGGFDVVVAKFSSAGVHQWTRMFGSALDDWGGGVAVDAAGGVYVVGSVAASMDGQPHVGGLDVVVVKYDGLGNREWVRMTGTPGDDRGQGVAVSSAGLVYVVGYVLGAVDGQPYAGDWDMLAVAYSTAGMHQWTRMVGTANTDAAYGAATDGTGGVYVVGRVGGSVDGQGYAGGNADVALVKYDAAGVKQWVRLVGTAGLDEGFAVAVDTSGAVWVAGYAGGSVDGQEFAGGLYDAVVMRYTAAGDRVWTRMLGTQQYDSGQGIAVGGTGEVYVVGYAGGSVDGQEFVGNDDAFLAEYTTARLEPRVSLTMPPAGKKFAAPADIMMRATADDLDGTVTAVSFFQGSTLLEQKFGVPYEYTWTGVGVGEYVLSARALDNDGLVGVSSSVVVHVVPYRAPSVTIRSPWDGSVLVQGDTVFISADAADSGGTVAFVEFLYAPADNPSAQVLIRTDWSTPYDATWSPGGTGRFIIIARAWNDLDVSREASVTVEVRSAQTVASGDVVVRNNVFTPGMGPENRCYIGFTVNGSDKRVAVTVHAVSGRLVRTLFDRTAAAGSYEVSWDGRDEHDQASPGMYLVRVQREGEGYVPTIRVLVRRAGP